MADQQTVATLVVAAALLAPGEDVLINGRDDRLVGPDLRREWDGSGRLRAERLGVLAEPDPDAEGASLRAFQDAHSLYLAIQPRVSEQAGIEVVVDSGGERRRLHVSSALGERRWRQIPPTGGESGHWYWSDIEWRAGADWTASPVGLVRGDDGQRVVLRPEVFEVEMRLDALRPPVRLMVDGGDRGPLLPREANPDDPRTWVTVVLSEPRPTVTDPLAAEVGEPRPPAGCRVASPGRGYEAGGGELSLSVADCSRDGMVLQAMVVYTEASLLAFERRCVLDVGAIEHDGCFEGWRPRREDLFVERMHVEEGAPVLVERRKVGERTFFLRDASWKSPALELATWERGRRLGLLFVPVDPQRRLGRMLRDRALVEAALALAAEVGWDAASGSAVPLAGSAGEQVAGPDGSRRGGVR